MKKVIFLDRDGVINKYPGHFKYVESVDGFEFIEGSKKAIALLHKAGLSVIVISNQAGVTKGIYTQETLDKITQKMISGVEAEGGKIDAVFYCTHTDKENCDCRKPKTGLIKKALAGLGRINLKNTFFVGDSIRDVKTGQAMGLKTMLVLSGRECLENQDNWEARPDFIADDLFKATEIILSKRKTK